MSSILDALKKIEEESIHASGLRPRIRREAGAGDRVRFFILDRALVLVLAAGLIGIGAGGFWAYSGFQSVPEQIQTASVAEPPTTAAADEKLPTKPKALPAAPAPVTPSKESDKTPTAKPFPEKTDRPEKPVASPVPVRPETPRSPAPLAQIPAPSTPLSATRPDRAPEPRAERRPLRMEPKTATTADRSDPFPNTAPESDSVPVLEGSSLTLQAISWANRPENRIAVINGRICREGEKIDRFVLQQINPDDIRIADGKNTWRLEFKIK